MSRRTVLAATVPVDVPAWTPYPEVSVDLGDHGPVTGAFTLTVQGDYCYAGTTGAHVNDDNLGVIHRGEGYLVGLRLHHRDGEWHGDDRPHVTRRESWSDAPPSYAAKIQSAVLDAVVAVLDASPELVLAGDRADAWQAVQSYARDRNEAASKFRDAETRYRDALTRAQRADVARTP